MSKIVNLAELAAHFGLEPGLDDKIALLTIQKAVRVYTGRTVCLVHGPHGIQMGAIVHKCSYTTCVYDLTWPFEAAAFHAHIDAIVMAADRLRGWVSDRAVAF